MFFKKEIAKLNSQTQTLEAFGRQIRKFMGTQSMQDTMFELWEKFHPNNDTKNGYISFLVGDPCAGDSDISIIPVDEFGRKRKVSIRYIHRQTSW